MYLEGFWFPEFYLFLIFFRTGHEVPGKHFEFFKNRNRRVLIDRRKEGRKEPADTGTHLI
jgi:hypothetical protein